MVLTLKNNCEKNHNVSFKNKLWCVLSHSTKFELKFNLYVRKKKNKAINIFHYWNRLGSKSNWILFKDLDNVDCSVNWTCQNGRSKMHVVIYSISRSVSSVSKDEDQVFTNDLQVLKACFIDNINMKMWSFCI
jgi:hypothetical protein